MNPEDRKKYIILGVLLIAAAGVVGYQVLSGPGAPPTLPANDRPQPTETEAPAAGSAFVRAEVDLDQLIDSIQEVDFNYETEAVPRNPMTPRIGVTGEAVVGERGLVGPVSPALSVARSMVITGIMYDSDEPVAVLENRADQEVEIVSVGHEFPVGILVESIEESRVVLRVGDMRIPKTLEEQ